MNRYSDLTLQNPIGQAFNTHIGYFYPVAWLKASEFQ